VGNLLVEDTSGICLQYRASVEYVVGNLNLQIHFSKGDRDVPWLLWWLCLVWSSISVLQLVWSSKVSGYVGRESYKLVCYLTGTSNKRIVPLTSAAC